MSGKQKKNKNQNKHDDLRICIYHVDDTCFCKERFFSNVCQGEKKCALYSAYSDNQFHESILKDKDGFILSVQIPDVTFDSFFNTEDGYLFKYVYQNPFFITVDFCLYNLESNIKFIFDDFDKKVLYENHSITINLAYPEKLRKFINVKYDSLKNYIKVENSIENEYGNFHFKMVISKKYLLDMFSKEFKSAKPVNIKENQDSFDKGIQKKQKREGAIKQDSLKTPSANKKPKYSKKLPIHNAVSAIVLSDTRKCFQNEHMIIDVKAKIRIAQPNAEISNYWLPAAYCSICQTYYVLKDDFKMAKKRGVLLCQVEDRTQDYIINHHNRSYSGGESRVHQLGYNVKKNNGLTRGQRHIILANMIENTDVSKHEIKSIISRCIRQHQAQDNYASSVSRWRDDLDFVNDYQIGDIPQVKLKKLIIKGQDVSETSSKKNNRKYLST